MNVTWTALALWLGPCAGGGGLVLLAGLGGMRWVRQPAPGPPPAGLALAAALILVALSLGPAWLYLPWSFPSAAQSVPVAAAEGGRQEARASEPADVPLAPIRPTTVENPEEVMGVPDASRIDLASRFAVE